MIFEAHMITLFIIKVKVYTCSSNDHIGISPNMLNTEPRVVKIFGACSSIWFKQMFF
jgi:hypothetical protein